MVTVAGSPPIPALAFASIRIPSQRQGFRRAPRNNDAGNVLLNVVRSEVHSLSNTLTRAPVDGQADRAQHIIPNPIMITITAIVSAATDSMVDSNIAFFGGPDVRTKDLTGSTAVNQNLRQLQLAARVGITANFSGLNKYATFWARLQKLNNERRPFEYISDLQVYQDMIFSSIDVERSTAEWIEFTAVMEEFRTAGVTRDRWLSEDQSDSSRDGKDAGTKTTGDVDVGELTSASPIPPGIDSSIAGAPGI